MPVETPSLHSTRLLRAYRMNTVETAKLKHQLFVLDKAKRREMRIANQDIRMINLTMDYINSSSGHSPEGRPPNYVDKSKREESGPMFLYGERVVSRKFGKKFRRVQSAFASRVRRQNDEDNDEEVENVPTTKALRPKSSPPKALRTTNNILDGFETETLMSGKDNNNVNGDSDNESCESTNDPRRNKKNHLNFEASRTTTTTPKNPVYLTQASTITTPSTLKDADINEIEIKIGETSMTVPVKEETKDKLLSSRPKSRQLSSRTHEMTKRVNEARVEMMNARKAKPDVKQAWGTSTSTLTKQKEVLEYKKSLNKDRNDVIDSRIKDFMDLYPMKKY